MKKLKAILTIVGVFIMLALILIGHQIYWLYKDIRRWLNEKMHLSRNDWPNKHWMGQLQNLPTEQQEQGLQGLQGDYYPDLWGEKGLPEMLFGYEQLRRVLWMLLRNKSPKHRRKMKTCFYCFRIISCRKGRCDNCNSPCDKKDTFSFDIKDYGGCCRFCHQELLDEIQEVRWWKL